MLLSLVAGAILATIRQIRKLPTEILACVLSSSRENEVRTKHPLRQRREELGLTMTEVSERTGIHLGNLSEIETGKAGVSVGNLIKLARALGLHALASELSYWSGGRS